MEAAKTKHMYLLTPLRFCCCAALHSKKTPQPQTTKINRGPGQRGTEPTVETILLEFVNGFHVFGMCEGVQKTLCEHLPQREGGGSSPLAIFRALLEAANITRTRR